MTSRMQTERQDHAPLDGVVEVLAGQQRRTEVADRGDRDHDQRLTAAVGGGHRHDRDVQGDERPEARRRRSGSRRPSRTAPRGRGGAPAGPGGRSGRRASTRSTGSSGRGRTGGSARRRRPSRPGFDDMDQDRRDGQADRQQDVRVVDGPVGGASQGPGQARDPGVLGPRDQVSTSRASVCVGWTPRPSPVRRSGYWAFAPSAGVASAAR